MLGRGAKQLEPADRQTLYSRHGARLAGVAAVSSPEEFTKAVKAAVQDVQADDGLCRFERQRRATALRTWVDRETGMVNIRGQFDPESGARLLGRLHNKVQALFAEAVPDTCPSDPERKQDHLRALALLSLTDSEGSGTGSSSGRAEMIVVIDEQTLRDGAREGSIVDAGAEIELPIETLRRLACSAHIYPAVLGSNGVVLDLGRGSRLANADQWRAMRAMYPTCMIDDCTVPFSSCELHHIDYWSHGGGTDDENLGPFCHRHHHAAHEGGWRLHLDPITRILTITYPDGTTRTCSPPRARAA